MTVVYYVLSSVQYSMSTAYILVSGWELGLLKFSFFLSSYFMGVLVVVVVNVLWCETLRY